MRRGFVLGGLAVALLLAAVVSNVAAGTPDGLDHTLRRGCTVDTSGEITAGSCMALAEHPHEVGGPLAGYGVAGVRQPYLATALAGGAGVLLTFVLGGGLLWLVRRSAGRR